MTFLFQINDVIHLLCIILFCCVNMFWWNLIF